MIQSQLQTQKSAVLKPDLETNLIYFKFNFELIPSEIRWL